MANRKASLDLSLETILKLVLGALIIIALIYMTYQLVMIFMSGDQDYRAKHNLELLADRVQTTISSKLVPPEASVVISLPGDAAILGFDPNQDTITLAQGDASTGSNVYDFKRPDLCSMTDTCLCVMRTGISLDGLQSVVAVSGNVHMTFDTKFLECKTVAAKHIVGSMPYFEVQSTGVKQRLNMAVHQSDLPSSYDLFFTPYVPGVGDTTHDVQILTKGDTVFLKI